MVGNKFKYNDKKAGKSTNKKRKAHMLKNVDVFYGNFRQGSANKQSYSYYIHN